MRRVGPGHQLRLGIGELNTERAKARLECFRTEDRKAGRPFFCQIAVIGFHRPREMEASLVQRLAGDEVDRAGNATVDHVSRAIFENFNTAQKFGRDIVERQLTSPVGGENVAAVQFRPHIGKAANNHARSFDRETIGIIALFKAGDVDPRHALKRFGHGPVGERADILGRDHVDKRVRVALYVLGTFKRLAKAGDNDFVFLISSFDGCFGISGGLRKRRLGSDGAQRQSRSRCQRHKAPRTRRSRCDFASQFVLPQFICGEYVHSVTFKCNSN